MPNRILPDFWRWDRVFNGLRVHAREFLFRLALAVDDYWRCPVGSSPQSPEVLRSMLYPSLPDIRLSDVARFLAEAVEAGAVLVADSERGWFAEMAEALRYRREDAQEGQPKYGPRIARGGGGAVKQQELGLGPVPLGPAPMAGGSRAVRKLAGRGGFKESQIQAIRVEGVVGDDGSGAQARGDSGAGAGVRDSKRLGMVDESEEGKRKRGVFSRGLWHLPEDEVWRDVCRFFMGEDLSCQEMFENGAAWMTRLKEDRGALAHAVQEGLMLKKEGYGFEQMGRWLTAAFERGRKRAAG